MSKLLWEKLPLRHYDTRILENWYYPLALYNGLSADRGANPLSNDPWNPLYTRTPKGSRTAFFNKGKPGVTGFFPYQECSYNIIYKPEEAFQAPYLAEYIKCQGAGEKVTLPGPSMVRNNEFGFDFVSDWFYATNQHAGKSETYGRFFEDGTVEFYEGGTKNSTTGIRKAAPVHVVEFGISDTPSLKIQGAVVDLAGNPVEGVRLLTTNSTLHPQAAKRAKWRKASATPNRFSALSTRQTRTGQNGRFSFKNMHPNDAILLTRAESVTPLPPLSIDVEAHRDTEISTIILPIPYLKPVLETQPADLQLVEGATAELQAHACGSGPLSFQWHKNGLALVGEKSSSLQLNDVSSDYQGFYTLYVSNAYGVTQSRVARITVKPNPSIKVFSVTRLVAAREHQGIAAVTIARSGDLSLKSQCSFETISGTAKPWLDFTPLQGSIVFEKDQSHAIIELSVIDDDLLEPAESLTLRLSSNGSKWNVTISIEDDETSPFLDWRGQFRGAVDGVAGQAGVVSLTVTGNGSFTGSYQMGATRHVLKGALDMNGQALVTLGKTGLLLRVEVDTSSNHSQVRFTLVGSNGDALAEGDGQRIESANYIASIAQGAYTMRLMRLTGPNLPAGDGYAYAKVDAKGKVIAAFKLPDGSSSTQTTTLLPSGTWATLLNPYAGSGGVYGQLRFLDASESDDLEGTLHWVKPPRPKDKLFPAGFDTEISVVGSRYVVAKIGIPWLPNFSAPPNNAAISYFHPMSSSLPATTLTSWLPGKGLTVPGVLSFTVNRSVGLLTGTITTPTRQQLSSAGVLLQKQGYAAGLFTMGTQTGSFEIRDVARPVEYIINVSADPVDGGSVSGGGTFTSGQTVTLLATPASGYEWSRWKENSETVANTTQLQFVAQANRMLMAEFAPRAPESFTDDLDRANADEVGNGWLNSTTKVGQGWTGEGVVNGRFSLVNQRAQNSQSSGIAGMYRSFSHSKALRVSATFSHINGGGGLQRRYLHCLGIRSNGEIGNGLAVMFYRGDQNYNNSTVSLYDGSTLISQQTTNFQFTDSIRAIVTFNLDGSVQVNVANADGRAGQQTLIFPARTVSADGGNVIFAINGSSGSLKGWADDVEIIQVP